ncbi:dihydropteroate synthase [Pseudonocardia alni]|uniref:dihydropteroate synthase n=1 Tax=Pseudonocardia alni TaxID=33907 RepID=UPI00280BC83A|nr:dihydropteroate synthase [Pseudonocardia alni]
MGIVNVTPDSFSDGGRFHSTDRAVTHGLALAEAGADYVDVGGESTRPGAARVHPDEEARRVLPVVRALSRSGVAVSVDTTRSVIAAAAVQAGAVLVNDVSGGLADPSMTNVIAELRVPWVLTHWRGHSATMERSAVYGDVVSDVRGELLARVDAAVGAGVDPDRLVIDPGLGFAKTPDHDLALLRSLPVLVGLGLPVLLGASRKRFLGRLISDDPAVPRPPQARDAATMATSTLAARAGVWGVRVHDVASTVDLLRVIAAAT